MIALLAMFLRPSVALWVCLGIPVSFTGAFLVMAATGTSINVLSLFGFILVLGIVVDDAIVTGENIYTHLRRGERGIDAAVDGTREVAVPVTFGVLTTIAARWPARNRRRRPAASVRNRCRRRRYARGRA